ncbi:iq calmodulin-binding motif protein [Grosmannia clavigera kw1407]|uniref:Iq calmodulin-binding motif protein n=1 Tax=Grosmannia clavigera (strain kw1407 / UAMH 11150) TaxID=655863 RepID=F0XS52_GROCL|nr:iq calmodulin-binding motif protein [Grosmannia clavigera kw1407]EFW99515.1 iq calmodulin-binding motif protein [Grosmannia clavigera kw1407]
MIDQTGASAISGETHSLPTASSAPPEAAYAERQPERGTHHHSRKSSSHQDYLDSLVVPPGDELARIAEVQRTREEQLKQRLRDLQRRRHSVEVSSPPTVEGVHAAPGRKGSLARHIGLTNGLDAMAQSRAAITIQRHYRGYRMRREMQGLCLDANTRWVQALRELQYRERTRPRARTQGTIADDGSRQWPRTSVSSAAATVVDTESTCSIGREPSAARRNWRKVTTIALRAGHDEESDSVSASASDTDAGSDVSGSTAEKRLARQHREEAKAARRREARTMGLQYFLEMVDPKHRYGANLRVYHEEWKRASTRDNFFYWLDRGDGRLVDMVACPRSRLEREQVRYLSREERQYYLVRIGPDGRLCWAKNGARIDTSEHFRDSIHGIVAVDDPTPAVQLAGGQASDSDSEGEAISGRSELVGAAQAGTVRKIRHVSATALLDALLRKSVQANTWIFVADTSFRLYVGIKDSGTFQHSSFLQGSRISAAGLIRIHDGHLESLSPLSGHYRPPTANFRAFVHSLKEAYAVLLGLEAYATTRQQGRKLLRRLGRHRQSDEVTVEDVAAAQTHGTDGKTGKHLLQRLSLGLRPASRTTDDNP